MAMLRRALLAPTLPTAAAVAARGGNATAAILAKVGRNLHRQPGHPIQRVVSAVHREVGADQFALFDGLDPVVTAEANFDSLLVSAVGLCAQAGRFLTRFVLRCICTLPRYVRLASYFLSSQGA